MAKFEVEFEVTTRKTLIIEAESAEDAEMQVKALWYDGAPLDSDYPGVEFVDVELDVLDAHEV